MPSNTTLSDNTRVLLVDDNDGILKRAAAVLSDGCTIVGAFTDGRLALEAAAVLHPDVIVLDISMPGMSGFELAASLKHAGSTAAVVFLTVHIVTALVEAFTLDHCLWASDWPYLRAPVRVDYGVLLQLVLTLFPNASDRRKLLWDTPRELFGFASPYHGNLYA